MTTGGLVVTATGPGTWANDYKIRIKRRVEVVTSPPTPPTSPPAEEPRFRLEVILEGDPDVTVESFENLSMSATDPRSVISVIDNGSAIITARTTATPTVPPDGVTELVGGTDGTPLQPDTGAFHTALNAGGSDTGVHLLTRVALFNLLCVPGETDVGPDLCKSCCDRRC